MGYEFGSLLASAPRNPGGPSPKGCEVLRKTRTLRRGVQRGLGQLVKVVLLPVPATLFRSQAQPTLGFRPPIFQAVRTEFTASFSMEGRSEM